TDQYGTTPENRVRAPSSTDHTYGSPNAPVKIIEFSDLECPFCKRFHTTMHQVMDEYGANNQVAWIYRHFPLQQLHPNATAAAIASECINEQAGNAAFWKFTDILATYQTRKGTSINELTAIARTLKINTKTFTSCLLSDRYTNHINNEIQDGTTSGIYGTPTSIIIGRKGKIQLIFGSQSYSQIKPMIDSALAE
ncbi:MAG: thioredoxin domain-containing protein, partial [bacterium]